MSLISRILGRTLASSEEAGQRIGPLAGVPVLGLDALSSAAYGPEAALTVLLVAGGLGLGAIGPIMLAVIALLFVVYLSYLQTIRAYPHGGGSYTVAGRNLGQRAVLLAAAALILDGSVRLIMRPVDEMRRWPEIQATPTTTVDHVWNA